MVPLLADFCRCHQSEVSGIFTINTFTTRRNTISLLSFTSLLIESPTFKDPKFSFTRNYSIQYYYVHFPLMPISKSIPLPVPLEGPEYPSAGIDLCPEVLPSWADFVF